jgi:hypothetical protein
MACPISAGLSALDCLDGKGGISTFYVTEFENQNTSTITAGTISAMALDTGKKFWEIKVEKEMAHAEEAETTSPENNTNAYVQTFTFDVNKISATNRTLLTTLAKNRLMLMYKDNNGNYVMFGWTGGYLSFSTASGTKFGDKNGYNAVFTSSEPESAYFVDSGIVSSLLTPAP